VSKKKTESFKEVDRERLCKLYSALYKKALPGAGILKKSELEMADFALSGGDIKKFRKTGLGLKVVCAHSAEHANTLIGHTGKVLLSLPFQFMPEHKHVDVDIFSKGHTLPKGDCKLSELVNDFEGIYDYNADGTVKMRNGKPVFRFRDRNYLITANLSGKRPKNAKNPRFHFEGKSETFKMVYGDAVLFSDKAVVLTKAQGKDRIPASFKKRIAEIRKEKAVTTKKMIYMGPGSEVLLPKGTLHALLAGKKGAVFLEFSTPTLDEADIFTDKKIIR
jgi:D-lyxose ketol-isomerase